MYAIEIPDRQNGILTVEIQIFDPTASEHASFITRGAQDRRDKSKNKKSRNPIGIPA